MWYVFNDGNNTIRAWGSSWTGLERVYFNDDLIARSNHFKRLEQIIFERDGHQYRIQCSSTSIQKWQVRCTLWRDDQKIASLKCKRRKVFNIRPSLAHLLAGIMVGILGGLLDTPAIFGILFIVISIIVTLVTTMKTSDFVIEQDSPITDLH
ncbi:hypothetical protein DWB84_17525 [Saccharophagus sp. K07]|nr:hypothetical protein [Saccharophagus sp. K07]